MARAPMVRFPYMKGAVTRFYAVWQGEAWRGEAWLGGAR